MDNLTNALAEAALVIGAGFCATILIRHAIDRWLERGNVDARARRRARAADAWHEAAVANRCTGRRRVARQGRADARTMRASSSGQMHRP